MIVDKPTTIIPINKPFWIFLELLLLNTINMNHLSFRRNYQTCYMLILWIRYAVPLLLTNNPLYFSYIFQYYPSIIDNTNYKRYVWCLSLLFYFIEIAGYE